METGIDAKMTEADLPTSNEEKDEIAKFAFRTIIGKLWWLALISRPDICFALHRCAIWQNRPSKKLKRWVVRIVAYVKATKTLGLVLTGMM